MGIHGLLKQLGPPPRTSLAKLAADHYATHANQPLTLAIDTAIWLFQIQSGKGGSNPALRTFYYRLLRLLSLNIRPLFVFDGPNKPLFKRNKKVGGGPGGHVRVASVPEFLAKQLLEQFGFPSHVAPGEAEAECALLQREGVVDAVLSEDVDTLMFGSGVTLRDWRSEGGGGKSPTHVSVYRAEETKERSRGMEREGMILVALMSGGDYLPEGIPGCGPKVACDAARAGFGTQLCQLNRKDTAGLQAWKDRLQHEIRTNESKSFSRKNPSFSMPPNFPNQELLGYYTRPCVSSAAKLQRLRERLKWDQSIDFPALRAFTADAFDWRCVSGAKKFIKNLASALLVRELRIRGEREAELSQDAQEVAERGLVGAVHGKRNHASVDGELEYRVSFTSATLVPIDLSREEEDDEFRPAGGWGAEETDTESEFVSLPTSSSTPAEADEEPFSPTKKRNFKPFDPEQPEKIWVLRTWVRVGCPGLVEEYEAGFRDPKEFLKMRRKARAAGRVGAEGERNVHAVKKKGAGGGRKKKGTEGSGMSEGAMIGFAKVRKVGVERDVDAVKGKGREMGRQPLREDSSQGNSQPNAAAAESAFDDLDLQKISGFQMPSTQIPAALLSKSAVRATQAPAPEEECETVDPSATPRPFAPFARKPATASATTSSQPAAKPQPNPKSKLKPKQPATATQQTPPRRKRPSPDLSSPALSQRTITSYYSPSPHKPRHQQNSQPVENVNLISSSPAKATGGPLTPTPPNLRHQFVRSPSPVQALPSLGDINGGPDIPAFSPGKLPNTVTKRRRKGPLKRCQTAPVQGKEDGLLPMYALTSSRVGKPGVLEEGDVGVMEAMDLASALSGRLAGGFLVDDEKEVGGDEDLPSPSSFFSGKQDLQDRWAVATAGRSGLGAGADKQSSSYPTPPADDDEIPDVPPPATAIKSKPVKPAAPKRISASLCSPPKATPTTATQQPTRRSPRQAQAKKKAFLLRQSLEGAWKEVDAETVDMSGDGSGWKRSGGRAAIVGAGVDGKALKAFRKSGVEILDMTGA